MAKGTHFFTKLARVRKLLVLDLGFLGDTVHLIPALWTIREALPEVDLHVMVAEHIVSLLDVCPWIDQVFGYPRFPKGPRWYQDFGRVRQLRQARYDAVINLNGSDRSSILTRATGAPLRLGRVPPKPTWLWQQLHTDVVKVEFGTMPVYQQRWQCLKAAGFPGERPEFHVALSPVLEGWVQHEFSEGERFVHVSPCTTVDYRELPLTLLASVLNKLNADVAMKIVLSCAPNSRERAKIKQLLTLLDFTPWRVYHGDISLGHLSAVISQARLHLGGDSGALHIALMMSTPTVAWFHDSSTEHTIEWQPRRSVDRTLFGEPSERGLQGITVNELMQAIEEVLGL